MTINLRPIVERLARVGVVASIVGAERTADGIEAEVEIRQRWFFRPAMWLLGAVLRVLVRLRIAHVVAALALLSLAACTVRQRLRAEVGALEGAAATLDTWEDLDKAQQDRCVEQARSYEEGDACLAAWSARARPAIDAAEQLHRIVRAARAHQPSAGARTAAAALAARLAVEIATLRPAAADGGSP